MSEVTQQETASTGIENKVPHATILDRLALRVAQYFQDSDYADRSQPFLLKPSIYVAIPTGLLALGMLLNHAPPQDTASFTFLFLNFLTAGMVTRQSRKLLETYSSDTEEKK